ncbi:MAG: hypothetical protein ACRCY8_10265 [Dermatophilaceae bacterium]
MEPDTDPSRHWLIYRDYEWDAEHRPVSTPRLITDEIASLQAGLDAEVRPLSEEGEPPTLSTVRVLTLAVVLDECAARLRLAAEQGNPVGSPELADLAVALGKDLYGYTSLRS